ncbi:hypothetical protein B5X24_HaOG205412 [Helicoverpa armigera]|nr:hypothetical protein B5X24_HaOG205412 [Helicoverpa armigera]
MSTESVPPVTDTGVADLMTTIAADTADTPINESGLISSTSAPEGQFTNISDTSALNITNPESELYNEYPIFQIFVIIELVMTTLELIISIVAAIKMPRWRRNYRNQMLMQLSFASLVIGL